MDKLYLKAIFSLYPESRLEDGVKLFDKDGNEIEIDKDRVEQKISELKLQQKIDELNRQRDKELEGFVIDGIYLNKEYIKDLSIKHSLLKDSEKAKWITADNKETLLTKEQIESLIKQGSERIEEIYFKYRKLKDEVLKGVN